MKKNKTQSFYEEKGLYDSKEDGKLIEQNEKESQETFEQEFMDFSGIDDVKKHCILSQTEYLKGNQKKDNNVASSSNKVYEKKKDMVDLYYDHVDDVYLKRAKLRELGMPYDEYFPNQYRNNLLAKIFSSSAIASGVLSSISSGNFLTADLNVGNILICGGVIGLVGAWMLGNVQDLKYRKALYELTNAYLESNGTIPEERIKKATGVYESHLPDKYDLACMEKEEREKIIEKSKNPDQLSKKERIKRIYGVIFRYQLENSTFKTESKGFFK